MSFLNRLVNGAKQSVNDATQRTMSQLAKNNPENFMTALQQNKATRQLFWQYLLNIKDFWQWQPQSKLALFQQAGLDGFATICKDIRACAISIGLVMTATYLPCLPLALLLGSQFLWLPGLLLGMAVIAASFAAEYMGLEITHNQSTIDKLHNVIQF